MVEDTGPSGLHAHLGYWLRMVSNAISQGFARRLEAEGVTVAEWVFLRMLYDSGEIAPSSLAEQMGMTRGAISKLADRLVDKKLVERGANPGDKRGQTLALAKPAKALVVRLAKLADENDAEFFGVLTVAERAEVEQLLRKIALEYKLTAIPLS